MGFSGMGSGGGGLLGDNGAGINAIAAAAARAASHASAIASTQPGRPPRPGTPHTPSAMKSSPGAHRAGAVQAGGGVFRLSSKLDFEAAGPFGALLHVREGMSSDSAPPLDLGLLEECVATFYAPTLPTHGFSSRIAAEDAMI